jgi:adenosylmethionine-8-amino-7-oxononanoate aminotransferase
MSDWLTPGLAHLWLPYTQMQTAPAPLPVVASRVRASAGRRARTDRRHFLVVDRLPRLPAPAHPPAVEAQLAALPHVMFAGLVHEPAAAPGGAAGRAAAGRPGARVLHRVRFGGGRSRAEDGDPVLAQQGAGRPKQRIVYFRHGYHGDTFATMALCDPGEGMHALFAGSMPDQIMAELPEDETMRRAFDLLLDTHRERLAAVIVEPLVQGAGGMKMHDAATLAFIAEACRAMACC